MRHQKRINKLGRTSSHRSAMLSNMAVSLIMHKRISTTVAKARELRKFIEPLVTKSKEDTTHSRRVVFATLHNKYAVTELYREIAQKVAKRPGGYTRILKTGFRPGDAAEMCIIEFVDYNETYTVASEAKKTTKTRRSRKSSAPKDAPAAEPVAETAAEPVAEAPEAPAAEETPAAE